jgi:hypothetical protein
MRTTTRTQTKKRKAKRIKIADIAKHRKTIEAYCKGGNSYIDIANA